MNLYLVLASLAFGVLSAVAGFSIKFYLLIDNRLRMADNAFYLLLKDKTLSDSYLVKILLQIVRLTTSKIETLELSQYGSLKRASETVRLEFLPGTSEQAPNYYAVNPIHEYDKEGKLTLGADHQIFYGAYRSAFSGRQQSSAFLFLMVAFVIQLISLIIP